MAPAGLLGICLGLPESRAGSVHVSLRDQQARLCLPPHAGVSENRLCLLLQAGISRGQGGASPSDWGPGTVQWPG